MANKICEYHNYCKEYSPENKKCLDTSKEGKPHTCGVYVNLHIYKNGSHHYQKPTGLAGILNLFFPGPLDKK